MFLSVCVWGRRWIGLGIIIESDIEELCKAWNNKAGSTNVAANLILQNMVLLCLRFDLEVTLRSRPGTENAVADALTRPAETSNLTILALLSKRFRRPISQELLDSFFLVSPNTIVSPTLSV